MSADIADVDEFEGDDWEGVETDAGSALVRPTGDSTTLAVWSAKTGQTVTLPLDLVALAKLRDALDNVLGD
ncbi:hypothetical protein [Nocardia salmonicida]|uniref:hypothetical protein n=1 Tax=Nocardia salmonicida TaxID=53431 RepID=UPI0036383E50